MHPGRLLLTTLAACATLAVEADAQQDFSGVRAFWAIAAQLQSGREPSNAAWDSLFATPGYAALAARERRRPQLMTGMRLALDPRFVWSRDSALALDTWTARVIRHITKVAADRAALDAFAGEVATRDLLGASLAQTQTLLPRGTVARFGLPAVAYLFFLPDGRGYPNLIVADLANVRAKTHPERFFAHEASHFYYARLSLEHSGARRPPRSATETALRALLTKLHEESLGDQHDKAPLLVLDSADLARTEPDSAWRAYIAEYRSHYVNGRRETMDLTRALSRALTDSSRGAAEIDSIARSLPLEGRPIGAWITGAIRRVHGDRRVRETVGDPIGWMLAFASAAREPRCGCGRLLPSFIALLEQSR